jgi:esterase/lipase superfamily enzyme
MNVPSSHRTVALITPVLPCLMGAILIAGCAGRSALMPTPSIYLAEGYSEDHIDPTLRNRSVDLVYVTDRAPDTDKSGSLKYGVVRSASMALGIAYVELGEESLDWPTLVEQRCVSNRPSEIYYQVASLEEIGRFPQTPYAFRLTESGMAMEPTVEYQRGQQQEKLKDLIKTRLELTPTKDVVMFVHGFNNSFEAASLSLAGIWHFLGRQGVPLLYSWPAARGGWRSAPRFPNCQPDHGSTGSRFRSDHTTPDGGTIRSGDWADHHLHVPV